MTGFLKRDFSLLLPNIKFYALIIAVFAVIGIMSDSVNSFASLYIVLFSFVSLMNLFNYDDLNRWQGYAAAAPNGRNAMVDARYLLSALMGLVVFVLQLFINLLSRANVVLYDFLYDPLYFFQNALLYGALFFLYAAVVLPILFRFGGTKARVVFVGAAALLGAVVAIAGTLLALPAVANFLYALPPFLPALAPFAIAALFLLSWLLSRRIMAKREL